MSSNSHTMKAPSTDAAPPVLPTWQILVVLVGFPVLYWLNSFTPWSYQLFVEQDHDYFLPFCVSLVILHWASVVVAAYFLLRAGGRLRDIGFRMRPLGMGIFVAVVLVVGIGFILLRGTWPPVDLSDPPMWQRLYPWTRNERLFGILLYFSAGFCEEFVYRGWGIRVLQARGMKTWQATSLAILSFILIHGTASLFMFPFLLVAGLFFSALFLWTKRLAPGMYVHALFDMMCLLAV